MLYYAQQYMCRDIQHIPYGMQYSILHHICALLLLNLYFFKKRPCFEASNFNALNARLIAHSKKVKQKEKEIKQSIQLYTSKRHLCRILNKLSTLKKKLSNANTLKQKNQSGVFQNICS